MEQEFHEGSPSAPLEVFRSSQPPFAPLLRVDGVTEAPRPPGQLRSLPEARRLMQLTLPLRSFREMRLEVGATAWPDAHLALCLGLRPRYVPAGELLFDGMHMLRSPLLIIAGYGVLLAKAPASEQPEEAASLGPGECLSQASLTWLQPLAFAAVARTDVQILELPAAPFAKRLQLPLLQVLRRREDLLSELPLLRQCPHAGLRALAHAGLERVHANGAPILREGDACEGLEVLTSGVAVVSVHLAPLASSSSSSGLKKKLAPAGGAPDTAPSAQLAEVGAPELLGVIDVLQALLDRGRKLAAATHRAAAAAAAPGSAPLCCAKAGSAAITAAASALAAEPLGGVHRASVTAHGKCRTLLLPTAELIRHLGTEALAELAAVAHDRSIIRSSLRTEAMRQRQRELTLATSSSYQKSLGPADPLGSRRDLLNVRSSSTSSALGPGSARRKKPPPTVPPLAGAPSWAPSTPASGSTPVLALGDSATALARSRSMPLTRSTTQLPEKSQPAPPVPPLPGLSARHGADRELASGVRAETAEPRHRSASTASLDALDGKVALPPRAATSYAPFSTLAMSASAPLLAHRPASQPWGGGGQGHPPSSPPRRSPHALTQLAPAVGTPQQLEHVGSRTRALNLSSSLAAIGRPLTADLPGVLAAIEDDDARVWRAARKAEERAAAAAEAAGASGLASEPLDPAAAHALALRRELEELKTARRLALEPAAQYGAHGRAPYDAHGRAQYDAHGRAARGGQQQQQQQQQVARKAPASWDARLRVAAGVDLFSNAADGSQGSKLVLLETTDSQSVPTADDSDSACLPAVSVPTEPPPAALAPSVAAVARVEDEYGWSHDAAQIWRSADVGGATIDAASTYFGGGGRKIVGGSQALAPHGILDDGVVVDTHEKDELQRGLLAKLDHILEIHHEEKPIKLTRFDPSQLE